MIAFSGSCQSSSAQVGPSPRLSSCVCSHSSKAHEAKTKRSMQSQAQAAKQCQQSCELYPRRPMTIAACMAIKTTTSLKHRPLRPMKQPSKPTDDDVLRALLSIKSSNKLHTAIKTTTTLHSQASPLMSMYYVLCNNQLVPQASKGSFNQ